MRTQVHVGYMLSPIHLLSVCLSVTLVHPTQPVEMFRNISMPFGTLAIRIDIHEKFYRDRPRGTHPSEELNTRGVAKCSNFGPIEGISRKWCKVGEKLTILRTAVLN